MRMCDKCSGSGYLLRGVDNSVMVAILLYEMYLVREGGVLR